MAGYAVVDVETTGLFPGRHDRIAEVAVVVLDMHGERVEVFETLVNPHRDLGPQSIHGLRAADVRRAPSFADIAGTLVEFFSGRVLVAHNAPFDLLFLDAEFRRLGVQIPLTARECLCTMSLSGNYIASANRTLASCCGAAGIEAVDAHSAKGDALAAADLLHTCLASAGEPPPWGNLLDVAERTVWPPVEVSKAAPVTRGGATGPGRDRTHFLARIVAGCEPAGNAAVQHYLEVLDQVLLDRLISDTEADHLVELAAQLSVSHSAARAAHFAYLESLACAAWADSVITPAERADLQAVAALLDLPASSVDEALAATEPQTHGATAGRPAIDHFELARGDLIVLTGEMSCPREQWERRAGAAGLLCGSSVTKKTKLVVAGDPDSMSGKARKAHDYGIPVVTEEGFAEMLAALGALRRREAH